MPSLNLAIARLLNTGTDNFAIWVVKAPYPSGYVLRDCVWPVELTQVCQEWKQMFGGDSRLNLPPNSTSQNTKPLPLEAISSPSGQTTGPYSSRLMQYLGMSLWRWVFDGPILGSLERSRGIAMGQHTRLRFRLEIRDPDLIDLPWEIMQREPGQSAMSLSQDLLFSRTSSEVDPLPYLRTDQALSILLVLGHDENLQLEQEALILQETFIDTPADNNSQKYAPCIVKKLLQPTPEELIQELETKAYNVFFYAGHGLPDPDGGLLFLRPGMTLNGIELAQALNRTGVKLAVFNACWGARSARSNNNQAIPASSLAEVLIRHGVPAVLGMRDEIADHESHSFIQAFAEALRLYKPIDEAVTQARKELLTLYRFNQPVWTLPVLYLHPDFNGELIKNLDEGVTELPDTAIPDVSSAVPSACLRSLSSKGKTWLLRYGVTRIGRTKENDIVIPEPSVSKRHAEIFCRNTLTDATLVRTYYLQDFSTYGTTWFLGPNGWQQILREEVPLKSGMQLKFGSIRGEVWEFIIEDS
ncbi:MAG: CHAT domain-containing protein [Nostoc sp. ChiSLP02]|nr:CHAT domain-containing protein [Nostoc sp. DedSLP05]MDZ8103495.1 CHAT domain-containing protein [Nostoc sp. DedSLP01]MDZ8185525.1 CHAT domain-containing protein [Nostoc sp. ChiSLP02]